MINRRIFLRQAGLTSLGFLGLQSFITSCQPSSAGTEGGTISSLGLSEGYGPLLDDIEGILQLPKGFTYKIISRHGDKMDDGFYVPGLADGMATFPGPDGKVIIIRNHEVSPEDVEYGPFGKRKELLKKMDKNKMYDYARGKRPGMGGTTTVVYNPFTGEVEQQYLSLSGTIRNCAGGPTPWGSWITCEEDTTPASKVFERNHGYNFEVPASVTPALADPIPLLDMGRFNHEAICVDPATSIVYQTEDRGDGLIYRYIPNEPGKLAKGGKLQLLAIKGAPSYDTRNWAELDTERMEINLKYEVEWIDIDDIHAPDDDLRFRGFQKGAARFARGEGMWFGEGELYFACTNGGELQHGQLFRYVPSPKEGTPDEKDQPGTLELFLEPNNIDLLKSCDNLTISPFGDVVLCEDRETPRIVGVSPQGEIYHIGKNTGFRSEFAGGVFSPDGNTYFVNIQGPGLTLAIQGPWNKRVV
ncbi:MAG: alkaline phosphatase PhoX [Bacteroidota bacterium]